MNRLLRILTAASLSVTVFLPTLASASDLNGKQVERWIDSLEGLHAFGEKHKQELEKHEREGATPDEMWSEANFIQPLHDAGLYDEADDMVEEYGYDTPEEWAKDSRRIMYAAMAAQLNQEIDLEAIKAQMEQLQNNPQIPESTKQQMKAQMAPTLAMAEATQNVPDGDKKAVEPYVEKIKTKMQQLWPEEEQR